MADADVTTRVEGVPARDCVLLTVTDDEEYTTSLSEIYGVNMTINEDVNDTYVPCISWSGRVITFHLNSITDKKVFVEVVGRL